MYTVKTLLLLALATVAPACVCAQNIEGQVVASEFGEFQIPSYGNGFTFPTAACQVSGGGKNFEAFSTGAPIKIVDSNPSLIEVVTPAAVFLAGGCSVSLPAAYSHSSFYLTSGTGGLQEALLSARTQAGGANTIILNAEWHGLVAPRSPATVIATVTGGAGFGLVDVTTAPYTYYSWNGSQYVTVASGGGGAPTGSAGGALSGSYPNPGLAAAALPNGMMATTQPAGDNSTALATDAFVLTNGGPASMGVISLRDPAIGGTCNWNGTTGTNDAPALQAAANAASAFYAATGTPGTVIVPYGCTNGTGSGHTTINVGSGVRFQGPGSIYVPAQSANPVFLMTSTDDDSFTGLKINVVSNLSACGPTQNNSACAAIRYDSASPGTGTTHKNISVVDNKIFNSGWGILIGPQAGTDLLENVHIRGNTISQTTAPIATYQYADGIHVGGAVSAVEITDNNVNGRGDAAIAVSSEMSTVLRPCHDVTIVGNNLYQNQVGIDNSGCSNVQITGNWVYSDKATVTSNPAFRSIYYNALPVNVSVTGNTFHNYQSSLGVPGNSAEFDCQGGCGTGGTASLLNSKFSGNKVLTFYDRGSQADISGNTFESGGELTVDWDSTNGYGSYNVTVGQNSWLNSGTINLANRTDVYAGGVLSPQAVAGSPLTISNQSLTLASVPNGTMATTQSPGDNTSKVATDAFVLANAAGGATLGANTYSGGQTMPQLNAPRWGTVYFADGFVSALYPGIGAATVAYSSAANVPLCQSVSYSGNYYIAMSASNASTTPGTSVTVWWPVPQSGATTPADCAWYVAEAAKHANHVNELVVLGNARYSTNGMVDFIDGSSYDDENSVGLAGSGVSATTLFYSGAAAIPMINRPVGGGNFSPFLIQDLTIDGNATASAAIELDTLNQSKLASISTGHVAPGSDHVIQLAHQGGYGFQVFTRDINIGIYPDSGTMNCGTYTANVVGGSITSYTVNNGGNCYASYGNGPNGQPIELTVVSVRGYKGNTAVQPCTVMPTGQVATIVGSAVTAISEGTNSGGSGCSGTIDVQVYQAANVATGLIFNASDSSTENIVSYLGSTVGMNLGSGNNTHIHPHPSVVENGIILSGASHTVGVECDGIGGYCIQIQQPFTQSGVSISGTNAYIGANRLLPGSATFYFAAATAATSPAIISNSTSLCVANPGGGAPADWNEFVTQSGPIVSQADWLSKTPAGLTVLGNDTSCGQAMGDYTGTLTVNTLNVGSAVTVPNGSTATTQSASDSTTKVATDAFVHAVSPLTQTANATGFSVAGGTTSKTLTVNNSVTLGGTDGTTETFPASSATLAGLGIAQSFSAAQTDSAAGAASTPGFTVSGAPYTAGSASTDFPQTYLNCSGATAVTTLSTAGTMFGINGCNGFTGHLMNLFVNGGSTRFRVDYQGNTFVAGTETVASNFGLSATTAPTMAPGAAAGTSPTCTSVTGNNNAGVITCITGTATTASATLATITFNGTLGTVPQGCSLTARNASTALAATSIYTTAPTSTSFTIGVATTALPVSTTFVWSYLCL